MKKIGFTFSRLPLILVSMALSVSAMVNTAVASTQLTQIKLASEEWEDATNKDGTGLYWDLMRLIYEPIGIKVQYSTATYSRSVALTKQKKVDGWLGSYFEEEDAILYPKFHFDADIVSALYKIKPGFEWKGKESLAGKNVGWMKGYDYNEYIDTQFKSKEFKERKKGLVLLDKGRLDFILEDQTELISALEKNHVNKDNFKYTTLMNLNIYPAFANNARGQELRKIYDERFDLLFKSGEIQALYDSWEWGDFPLD